MYTACGLLVGLFGPLWDCVSVDGPPKRLPTHSERHSPAWGKVLQRVHLLPCMPRGAHCVVLEFQCRALPPMAAQETAVERGSRPSDECAPPASQRDSDFRPGFPPPASGETIGQLPCGGCRLQPVEASLVGCRVDVREFSQLCLQAFGTMAIPPSERCPSSGAGLGATRGCFRKHPGPSIQWLHLLQHHQARRPSRPPPNTPAPQPPPSLTASSCAASAFPTRSTPSAASTGTLVSQRAGTGRASGCACGLGVKQADRCSSRNLGPAFAEPSHPSVAMHLIRQLIPGEWHLAAAPRGLIAASMSLRASTAPIPS